MISVIGAGVAGSVFARELASMQEVSVFERKTHNKKTCSAILTHKIEDIERIPEKFIKSKVNLTRIHSPDGKYVEIEFKKPDLIYNREELNTYFVDKAVKAGAKIYRDHELVGVHIKKENNHYEAILNLKDRKGNMHKEVRSQYLIGADGCLSNTAKLLHIYGNRRMFIGFKAELKAKHDNIIHFYPYITDFAWQNPIDDKTIEVGMCIELGKPYARDASARFDAFLKRFPGKLLSREAAMIPIWNPSQQLQKHNSLLIGDAATINKPTTGGGIIYGIISARIAAHEIQNVMLGKQKEIHYASMLKKRLGNNLWMHLKIRDVLNKFSDDEWNHLIDRFQKPALKHILASHSRDFPLQFSTKVFASDPGLLKYISKLL
jgi:digeranylgeranylglycerophospholipid reductase